MTAMVHIPDPCDTATVCCQRVTYVQKGGHWWWLCSSGLQCSTAACFAYGLAWHVHESRMIAGGLQLALFAGASS